MAIKIHCKRMFKFEALSGIQKIIVSKKKNELKTFNPF